MAEGKKLELITSSPRTYDIESPIGLITVNSLSVGEHLDARKSGTFDEFVRNKMIVSVSKTPNAPPVLAVDLTDEEMEEVVKFVNEEKEAKLKDSTKLVKNLIGGTMTAAALAPSVAGLLSGANFLRANASQRMHLGLTETVRPPGTEPFRELLNIDAEKRGRERLALEAQIKTAELLEEVHNQLAETERQNQQGHDLQKRIFAGVLATLALTAVGVIAAVIIQLS